MSLFDDEFYSTKVSRRIRWKKEQEIPEIAGSGRGWTSLRIAFMSSFISALAVVLLFSLITGVGNGGGNRTVAPTTSPIQVTDPFERPIQAAAKIGPAVVSIINEQVFPLGLDDFGLGDPEADSDSEEEEEESAAPWPYDDDELQQAGLGSGVIFEKAGSKARIVTNYHVVENAVSVKAVLVGGEVREATVIGKDRITDLAVLEIDGKGIDITAEIGDSTKLRDGETVIAIGNPLGLGDSLTMGIVSKTRRVIPVSLNQDGIYDWEQEVIQIDASINQGNSGGALVDLNGRLIGINSMKVADYGVEGLGFAIPMHNAMPVIQSLIEHGKVKRPYVGVYTLDLEQYYAQKAFKSNSKDNGDSEVEELNLPPELRRGIIVLEAVGPAKKAGLKFNDVIVKLDRQDVGSTMELRKYLYTKKTIGDKIEITFYRDGKKQTTTMTLTEMPEEE
ncbi:S1C family serine protease [Paenibacillus tarimensis]